MSRMAPTDHPRPTRRDPHKRLMASILALAGPNASVESISVHPWASATFQGSRHKIVLIFTGDNAQQRVALFIDQAPEAEFAISGHIVADLAIDGRWTDPNAALDPPQVRVALSALLIEDW
ncbi:MAG: hypothetical protein ACO1NM_10840 [Sphingobium phenoxybenzoativorans]|uniref:hypothetical protein n=1 Tax=Sphingobium phenoxybenzoativorans TaxID=1592790 RepID=UPI000871CD59|nr:hypothetical protein [Sphingobium phenoxybenzoativorans]